VAEAAALDCDWLLVARATQFAEKVDSEKILVAQALCLRVFLNISAHPQGNLSQKAHRQSACATWSAACSACGI
jgi:hypothetical protein